jgi:hypothetical protein
VLLCLNWSCITCMWYTLTLCYIFFTFSHNYIIKTKCPKHVEQHQYCYMHNCHCAFCWFNECIYINLMVFREKKISCPQWELKCEHSRVPVLTMLSWLNFYISIRKCQHSQTLSRGPKGNISSSSVVTHWHSSSW